MPDHDPSDQVGPTTPESLVAAVYAKFPDALEVTRERLARPLTFAEKILAAHADDPRCVGWTRGFDYADYRPDRVALQDATAQMTLLQFMLAKLPAVAVPTTVHCDHLIQARTGADADMHVALDDNREVYEFLRTVSAKYGIGFWQPGSGIIHQVVLENYAFPGGMMIGADSHTPNACGLGMLAIGVGGADAVDVMAGWPYNTRVPKLIGVRLTGALSGWTAAKDIILKVAGMLTVKGGTDAIVQYFGPGTESISATGKATVCNMGAEIGATCSLFPVRPQHRPVPEGDGPGADRRSRRPVRRASRRRPRSRGRSGAVLRPRDRDRPVDARAAPRRSAHARPRPPGVAGRGRRRAHGLPAGDLGRARRIVHELLLRGHRARRRISPRQAAARGLRVKAPLMITPGSEQVRATIERDGLLADLEAIGATVLANACGPCIGQWRRADAPSGPNVIVTSFNRNFPARNDGNKETLAFIGSPETVVGMALSGRLDGSFLTEFDPPVADDLPAAWFRSRRERVRRARDRPRRRDRRGRAGLRPARTARAVPRLGRPRHPRRCACC